LKEEDIEVVIEAAVIAFPPVKVYSEHYAMVEYDVSDEELAAFAQAANKELDRESKQATLNGSPEN
jgi:hypothetical protein